MRAEQVAVRPIYTTPSGFAVYEFSHSQYSTYHGCGKEYEFMKVKGWRWKPGAAMEFGKAIQEAVRLFYVEKRDPVEEIEKLWRLFNPAWVESEIAKLAAQDVVEDFKKVLDVAIKIKYPEKESWETFNRAGVGLMTTLKNTWESFPLRKPVWPDWKRDPVKVRHAETGLVYQTIPDLIDQDDKGRFMADLKSMGALLNDEVPGLVINDLQLRTQAAATKIYRVALWNFCRKPKQAEPLSAEKIYEEVRAGLGGLRFQSIPHVALLAAREANGLTIDAAGEFMKIGAPKDITKEWKQQVKQDESLGVVAQEIAAKLAAMNAPVFKIQWVEGTMTEAHAMEAIREEMSVVPLIQSEYFPRRGGVRFPDNSCTYCACRGLCMEEIFGPNPVYTQITNDELDPWDVKAFEGL